MILDAAPQFIQSEKGCYIIMCQCQYRSIIFHMLPLGGIGSRKHGNIVPEGTARQKMKDGAQTFNLTIIRHTSALSHFLHEDVSKVHH